MDQSDQSTTAVSYKHEEGHTYNHNQCFPARSLLERKEDGVHWLVSYRHVEKQKQRNLHQRIKETYRTCVSNTRVDTSRGSTLDGLFLLQLHGVDEPSELCSIDISEQNLTTVNPDDLKVFNNVAYIDASINSLSLGSFSCFVSLRELNLSLNRLCNMIFHAADFPHLEVLDLSYNCLSADGIVSIGRIPSLKVLHLTGNDLYHLPPHLGCSNHGPTRLDAEEEESQFKALEVLMLDDNKLSSGVFSSLASLKRLRYLNLQGNRISKIPYLEPTDCSKPLEPSVEEQAEKKADAHTEPRTNANEHVEKTSQVIFKEEYCGGSSLPLPELQFLQLADNRIAEEDALISVALFPSLREIDIHSNPLVRRRSGDPPLLTYYLHDRLGITIKRKETQGTMKPPIKVSTDPNWQVEERLPKVSKIPLLMMDAPGPAQTGAEESEARPESLQENRETFFVTQATDASEHTFDLVSDVRETAESEERLEGDMGEHIGIQTAVRMLEHILKNLNVYRDSKPKCDSFQAPYRERERRIKSLPPLKPVKQPTERVDEMFKEFKANTTIREVALGSVIHGTGVNKRDYKEAQSLLREMKAKYKMVHKKTMEQEASMDSETDIKQNEAQRPPAQSL